MKLYLILTATLMFGASTLAQATVIPLDATPTIKATTFGFVQEARNGADDGPNHDANDDHGGDRDDSSSDDGPNHDSDDDHSSSSSDDDSTMITRVAAVAVVVAVMTTTSATAIRPAQSKSPDAASRVFPAARAATAPTTWSNILNARTRQAKPSQ
jgi:hypothetical protein